MIHFLLLSYKSLSAASIFSMKSGSDELENFFSLLRPMPTPPLKASSYLSGRVNNPLKKGALFFLRKAFLLARISEIAGPSSHRRWH